MSVVRSRLAVPWLLLALLAGCAKHRPYHDPNMDFSGVKTVAVMPFWNLTQNQQSADRVREVFSNALLSTRAVYVMPNGEVARAISRVGLTSSSSPTAEEMAKLCPMLKADAVITGVVKEYGEVRATSAVSNVVSVGVQMQECATGKVVWAATSTKGGVTWAARLLGTGGGEPLNDVTEDAVDDLLRKLFQ
ncbi:GNA1162 family protein [Anaeromyxobacter paludicola]|uniref:Lipoprotein n=1 Tax=Anaeromyxobacter paludicola TaxID=2918171 RepID=A0ABM7XBH9_9BACT|nr:GNA1162 family protein [Anaeromyxobacter paludicola]BDG09222.1 lipoprotein [Anaeromyxobacter paludicola]